MSTKLLAALILLPCSALAQGLPPIERTFSSGGTLRFYGQINKGVLQYDDGRETESYGPIDNNNSNTRAGITYKQAFGDWDFENVNEIQYAPYSSSDINILQQTPTADDWEFTNTNIRKIDFSFANDRYGKFWIGQGSMSTDGVPEVDFSGTKVIGYSKVQETAGAQLIRFSDPALSFDESISGIEIQDAFTNYNGPRRVRVRYDTPEVAGFGAAASYGRDLLSDESDVREQTLFDIALRYSNEFDVFKVEGAAGFFRNESTDTDVWSGSGSVLHAPIGLNATLATGSQDASGDTGTFWYGKLGLLRRFISWGDTAAAIDYYSGDDIFLSQDDGITSSTSDSWGLMLVQTIDRANTELWLTYRNYDYADDFASYDDGRAIFGGARLRF